MEDGEAGGPVDEGVMNAVDTQLLANLRQVHAAIRDHYNDDGVILEAVAWIERRLAPVAPPIRVYTPLVRDRTAELEGDLRRAYKHIEHLERELRQAERRQQRLERAIEWRELDDPVPHHVFLEPELRI